MRTRQTVMDSVVLKSLESFLKDIQNLSYRPVLKPVLHESNSGTNPCDYWSNQRTSENQTCVLLRYSFYEVTFLIQLCFFVFSCCNQEQNIEHSCQTEVKIQEPQ